MSQKNNRRSISEKTAELNELVGWFDGENFTLEEALEKFRQAELLGAEIEQDLMEMKNEVMVIKQRFDDESV